MDDKTLTHECLNVDGLVKAFDNTRVLDELSFSIAPGRSLAIIGRSGSGKSTLLRCLNLIEMPDAGQLSVNGQLYFEEGQVLFEPWEVRRQIGLVLQQYSLFPNLTVHANLQLALRSNFGYSRRDVRTAIDQVAETLGVTELYYRYPNQLSGGQLQRCALARALVLKPKVLLLDEITSALDPATVSDVELAIKQVRSAPNVGTMSLVIVTHLYSFAEAFADEIAFLYSGKIWERHAASRFKALAAKPETKRFLDALPL